jgi:hypothetical protein
MFRFAEDSIGLTPIYNFISMLEAEKHPVLQGYTIKLLNNRVNNVDRRYFLITIPTTTDSPVHDVFTGHIPQERHLTVDGLLNSKRPEPHYTEKDFYHSVTLDFMNPNRVLHVYFDINKEEPEIWAKRLEATGDVFFRLSESEENLAKNNAEPAFKLLRALFRLKQAEIQKIKEELDKLSRDLDCSKDEVQYCMDGEKYIEAIRVINILSEKNPTELSQIKMRNQFSEKVRKKIDDIKAREKNKEILGDEEEEDDKENVSEKEREQLKKSIKGPYKSTPDKGILHQYSGLLNQATRTQASSPSQANSPLNAKAGKKSSKRASAVTF